ncbi:beta strand repeat-containing protein [Paenibacillus allorhizosphaerae]|nr:carboxypeptidase-like regulatory domain-containing protein [Paenibacillus allorhizosphaerae]
MIRSRIFTKSLLKLFAFFIVAICIQFGHSNVSNAAATGTISGTVSNGSGNPVSGATVSVSGVSGSATTDANGKYTLNVPAGTYQYVSVGATGYANYAQNNIQVNEGNATTVNFSYGAISGIVTDESGNPLSGANVYTYNAFQTTSAGGTYTLNVPPGTYSVYADKNSAGYNKSTKDNVQVTAGDTTNVNFSYGAISGTVTNASGNPVSGASVFASNSGSATTDASGKYMLKVPVGTYAYVQVNASGYAAYAQNNIQVTAGNTTTLGFSYGAISGTVTDGNGNPVSGSSVYTNIASQTTNTSGSYTLNVPPGTYSVTVGSKPGYGSYSQTNIQVTGGNMATVHFSYGAISGTVTNGSGNPVTGATVYASGSNGSVTTDASGKYTLHVPAGTYDYVQAYASGYANYNQNNINVTAGNVATVHFSYGAISGTVTDAGGNPVSDATVYTNSTSQKTNASGAYMLNVVPGTYTVTVSKSGYAPYSQNNIEATAGNTTTAHFSYGAVSGAVRDANGNPVSGATVYAHNVSGSVTADASGKYTLNVPAGTYANVTAYATGYPNYIQNNIQVIAGNTTTIDFSYGAVSGTVNDANGNPVSGATVYANNVSGSATTNANGKYSLNFAPGTYTLTVSKTGYPTESKTNIQVTAGQTTTVNFGDFSSGTISGTVTDASGNPVSGATVFAANVPGSSTTDASGTYTLNVPAGTYTYVQAYADGFAPYYQNNIQVTAGNTTTLHFSYGAISGTVKDANGNPVEGATVSNGAINRATNAGGAYTLNVPPGTYTVSVFKTGYPSDSKTNIQVTAGQTTTVNFGNISSGAISGTVTDASGNPVSGATVAASGFGSATTDASGKYTLNAPVGTYTVTVAKAEFASFSKNNIQVTAGNTTEVNFSYGAISGTVKDENGNPVSGAAVSTGGISQATNAGGSYTLNVPPGTYRVTVSKTGHPTESKNDIQVTAGQITTVNFGILRSAAPLPANITVVNNVAGTPDTITVKGLTAGDVIKVYNMETGGNLLTTSNPVINGQSSVTASVYQLGTAAGYVYVSVTSTGKTESIRTAAAYGAEPADTVAPVTKYRLDPIYAQSSTGKPYIKGFTVTLQATDNQSGVKNIKYRVNGAAWTTYTAPFTIYAETTHTVDYFSTDNAGNAEVPVNTMDFDKGKFTGAGSF